jgi:hypothetical protein
VAILGPIFRILIILLALVQFHTRSLAQIRESELKAAFVFNFAQFVGWPTNCFPSTNAPLIIGMLGAPNETFIQILQELTRGEFVGTHPVEIRRFSRVDEALVCHILFISANEDSRLQPILRAVEKRPILSVSDMNEFARRGGMIQLYTSENKVRFAINQTEARNAGLEISSKLLRLAELVETGRRR